MQIKGVMGFGKTDEQYTGSVMLQGVFEVTVWDGVQEFGFCV